MPSFRMNIFKKSNKKSSKKPDGLEVTATKKTSTVHFEDGVSAMTPITGLPPEDHPGHRLKSLGMDAPQSNGADALYSISYSSHSNEDEMSAITSPSPEKAPKNRGFNFGRGELSAKRVLNPPTLPGDDDSGDIMVYEDGTTGSQLTPRSSPVNATGSVNSRGISGQLDSVRRVTSEKLSDVIAQNNSWLTRSKYFQQMVDASFDMVDADKSGDITLDEMYAGLLLIHLKLAVYVGAPACRPASRKYVSEMFHLLKSDDNDTLDREEFAVVMKILYSQVFTRIVIQWTLTLMIVPILSQYIMEYTSLAWWIAHEFWKDIDDDLDPLQRLLYKWWLSFLTITPEWLDNIGRYIIKLCNMVPWETWESMPKLILNSLLVFVVVPYALNHVEDFFRRVAHKADADEDKEKRD